MNAPGIATGETDKDPTLTPLLTVSSRSWLSFQMLALLPGNQWTRRWPGWASVPGNGIYILGYQDCRGGPWTLSLALEAPTNLAPADLSGFIT